VAITLKLFYTYITFNHCNKATMPRTRKSVAQAKKLERLLQSDDDSDDELPQGNPLQFSQNSGTTTETGADGSPNSSASSSSRDGDDSPEKQPVVTETEEDNDDPTTTAAQLLEDKARERIAKCSATLVDPWIKAIKYDMMQLMWYRQKKDKKSICTYPCRKCPSDEAVGLALKQRTRHQTVLIQYVGHQIEFACEREYVSPKHLVPFMVATDEDDSTRRINPECLQSFLDTIRNRTEFQNNPLDRVLEKCILEAMVQKCCQEGRGGHGAAAAASATKARPPLPDTQEQSPSSGNHSNNNGRLDCADEDKINDDDAPTFSQAWKEEEEPQHDPSNTETKKKNKSENKPSWEDWDPNAKPKIQPLREGDTVCYDEPTKVAGTDIRTAQVCQVVSSTRKDDEFCLFLSDGQMLRRMDRVKVVQKMFRGKLVVNKDAKFQPIGNYRLIATTSSAAAAKGPTNKKLVQDIRTKIQEVHDGMASNKDTAMLADLCYGAKNTNKRNKKKTKAPSSSKKRRATFIPQATKDDAVLDDAKHDAKEEAPTKRSTKKKRRMTLSSTTTSSKSTTASPAPPTSTTTTSSTPTEEHSDHHLITEVWWIRSSRDCMVELIQQAEAAEAKAKKDAAASDKTPSSCRRASRRGRVSLHMSSEQLKLAVQVRSQLKQMVLESQGKQSVTSILNEIVQERDRQELPVDESFSVCNLQDFLAGDENMLVRKVVVNEIAKFFQLWVKQFAPSSQEKVSSDQQNATHSSSMHEEGNATAAMEVATATTTGGPDASGVAAPKAAKKDYPSAATKESRKSSAVFATTVESTVSPVEEGSEKSSSPQDLLHENGNDNKLSQELVPVVSTLQESQLGTVKPQQQQQPVEQDTNAHKKMKNQQQVQEGATSSPSGNNHLH
jgi:hypothetical protein